MRAAHPKPHDADAHIGNRLIGIQQHILLPRRPRRHFGLDDLLLSAPGQDKKENQ